MDSKVKEQQKEKKVWVSPELQFENVKDTQGGRYSSVRETARSYHT